MDNNVVNFIRDRFNSLEKTMTDGFVDIKADMAEGFVKHETRIRTLEDDKLERKTKLVAYGSIGGLLSTGFFWVLGKIF